MAVHGGGSPVTSVTPRALPDNQKPKPPAGGGTEPPPVIDTGLPPDKPPNGGKPPPDGGGGTEPPPDSGYPEGYTPPMVAGGLFVNPNWTPRLVDRSGSVRTDLGGVAEHWPRDIAHVFYPHLPNPFWLEVPQPEAPTEVPPEAPPGDVHVEKIIIAPAGTIPDPVIEALAAEEESSDVPSEPPGASPADVSQVAQTIQENAEAIGEAAQNIGEAAQSLTEPPQASGAPTTASEVPGAPEGTTEPAPDLTEYEMDQMWGIEGSAPTP